MKLDGQKIEAIQNALISAFNLSELKQMVRFGLDVDLDDISLAGNLKDVTFQLIEWAERQGKLDLLIQEAYKANPHNPELKALYHEHHFDIPQRIQRKIQKRNWLLFIPIGIVVIGLIGVLVSEINRRLIANIPIKATETAEAVETTEAHFTEFPNITVTPTFTTAPGLTPSLTATPAFTSTQEALTFTPTPSWTPTVPTSTPFYDILFQDGFIDNTNGWFNQSEEFPGGMNVGSKIAGGKYTITMSCPSHNKDSYCRINRQIPFGTPQNFYMQFDEKIKSASPDAEWIIGIQYRRNGGYYYLVDFRSNRSIASQLQEGVQTTYLLEETPIPLRTGVGETNILGLRADGTAFSLYLDKEPVGSFEDGNIKQPGESFLVFFVLRGSSVTFEIDNFILGSLRK